MNKTKTKEPHQTTATYQQGKLYLYESAQPGARLADTQSVWADRRVVRVPPGQAGGAEHVVALCPGKAAAGRLVFGGEFAPVGIRRPRSADGRLRGCLQTAGTLSTRPPPSPLCREH